MNDANTCTVLFADKTRCTRAVQARGWCNTCYQWSRNNAWQDPDGRYPKGTKPKTSTKTCSVVFADGADCTEPAKARGWCDACHAWSRSNGWTDPNGRQPRIKVDRSEICTVKFADGTDCTREIWYAIYGGICSPCYKHSVTHNESPHGRRQNMPRPTVDNTCSLCDAKAKVYGWCAMHYTRWQRHGDPNAKVLTDPDPWTVVYVVTDGRTVKLGVTSGNGQTRLREHVRDYGLTERLRVITGMPDGAAKWLEDQCLAVLREEGAVPVRGREYFDAEWTWLILSIVDRFS